MAVWVPRCCFIAVGDMASTSLGLDQQDSKTGLPTAVTEFAAFSNALEGGYSASVPVKWRQPAVSESRDPTKKLERTKDTQLGKRWD